MSEVIASGFQLSPQQKHLSMLQANEPAFHSGLAVLLEGKLDADKLQKALHAVIARHEIFRTGFHRQPGMKFPVQVVSETVAASWEHVDLRPLFQVPEANGAVGPTGRQPVDAADGEDLAIGMKRERLNNAAVQGIGNEQRRLAALNVPEPDGHAGGPSGGDGGKGARGGNGGIGGEGGNGAEITVTNNSCAVTVSIANGASNAGSGGKELPTG